MKVNIEQLKELGYEEGEKLLISEGYVQGDYCKDEQAPSCDYIEDFYFTLYEKDEEGYEEEVHTVSFARFMNKNFDPLNDDGSGDFVVKQGWCEL